MLDCLDSNKHLLEPVRAPLRLSQYVSNVYRRFDKHQLSTPATTAQQQHLLLEGPSPATFFVRSTKPLINRQDFKDCEIVFQVLPGDTVKADIFSPNYAPAVKEATSPWMLWKDFRQKFPEDIECEWNTPTLSRVECWAREKMVVTLEHAYGDRETLNSGWACFNVGTRAFKGLLGYESAYRWYVGAMLDSLIDDKIMYAELRPMLLDKDLPTDDGRGKLGHFEQMQIICDAVKEKQEALKAKGRIDQFPFGVKVIYCTPRSIPRPKMRSELDDCLKLKTKFPELVCGFDLVGAEDRPNGIGFYGDMLSAFGEVCKKEKIELVREGSARCR